MKLDPTPAEARNGAAVASRRVVFVLYAGFQVLDLTGPHEVFAAANQVLDHRKSNDPRYAIELCAETVGPVRSESGLAVVADVSFDSVAETGGSTPGTMHSLIVLGGNAAPVLEPDDPAIEFVRIHAPRAGRVASVCSGTFLLAEAGVLDGLRVTTHWRRSGLLAKRYPKLRVDPDAIYVQQDRIWTSAGVTAGIDLALALVEQDCGADVAQLIARNLVVPLRRPGNQTQYAAPVWCDPIDAGPVREAHSLIHADPGASLGVGELAARVGMSERNFARRFREEVGEPPARYVERVRVEAARTLLETSALTIELIADRCGFGTAETVRRAFHRRLGLSPEAYRRQHAAAEPTHPIPYQTRSNHADSHRPVQPGHRS